MKDEAQSKVAEALRAWPLGLYRHYKRSDYILYSVTVHEATLEPMLHYYSLGHGTRWSRFLSDFSAKVEHSGSRVPRFQYVGPCTAEQLARAAGVAT